MQVVLGHFVGVFMIGYRKITALSRILRDSAKYKRIMKYQTNISMQFHAFIITIITKQCMKILALVSLLSLCSHTSVLWSLILYEFLSLGCAWFVSFSGIFLNTEMLLFSKQVYNLWLQDKETKKANLLWKGHLSIACFLPSYISLDF